MQSCIGDYEKILILINNQVSIKLPDINQFLPQTHLSAILSGNVSAVGEKERADYKKRKLVVEVTDAEPSSV